MQISMRGRAKEVSTAALRTEVCTSLQAITQAQHIFKHGNYGESDPVDYSGYSVLGSFMRLFDYAFNGRRYAQEGMDTDFYDATHLAVISGPCCEAFHFGTPVLCEETLVAAYARLRLDYLSGIGTDEFSNLGEFFPITEESTFSVRDMALLARMTDQSVRNATNKKSKHFLPTTRASGLLVIDYVDAIEWLNNRRGFVATVPYNPDEVK